MDSYIRFPYLGTVFVLEVLYAVRRAHFLPARCHAQTRCSWQALFTFAFVVAAADGRWPELQLVAVQLLFLLAWGRVQHLTLAHHARGWRQAAWAAGLAATAAPLAVALLLPSEPRALLVWVGVWAFLLMTALVTLCHRENHHSMEYEHLVWALLLYLGASLPLAAVALLAWPEWPHYALAHAAVFGVLYLRMRLPVLVRSFVYRQSYLEQFLTETDALHIDVKTVYEAVECQRAMAKYLLRVDEDTRECFLAVEDAYDSYVRGSGVASERLAPVLPFLRSMGITHTTDLVLTRKKLLDHMHSSYDWKILGPLARLNSFFCPCLPSPRKAPSLPSPLVEVSSDNELDYSGSDVTMGSSDRDEKNVVYVEFSEFTNNNIEGDGTPLISPDGRRD